MAEDKRTKLLHMTTVSESLGFLTGQVRYMKSKGFDVSGLTSPGEHVESFSNSEGIPIYTITMPRRITPLQDLKAIFMIRKQLRQIKPHIVHAHTPKGGLLGMISAWLAGVPLRIYHIHGLPLQTATGYKKILLRWSEKVSCRLAHQVFCVSESLQDIVISSGLCPSSKTKVILHGSINGVDAADRFNKDNIPAGTRDSVRRRFQIPSDALVLGYIGRVVKDKGIEELIKAWTSLRKEYQQLHLLIIGPLEPQDPISPETEQVLRNDSRIHLVGLDWNTPPYYAAMDVFALPTYREGFGTVLMEAAAMELPVVSTLIPGCMNAVDNGVTGTLVQPQDADALAAAIRAYLNDPNLCKRHGEAGRKRMLSDFRQEVLWEAVYQEYVRLLKKRNLPLPASTTCDYVSTEK